MIKRIRKTEKSAKKWYDKVYTSGGYKAADKNYDKKMLNQLGVQIDMKKTLLDVACGNGFLLREAGKRVKAAGIDLSEIAARNASRRADKSLLCCGSAERLPFRSGTFDFVTCLGSLEHFIKIDNALSEMKRVMKLDGKANIHVPNSRYLVHKVLRIDSQGQPNERLATEKEWKEVLEKHFFIEATHKFNTRPYLSWIPKKYCCHFTFICRKD